MTIQLRNTAVTNAGRYFFHCQVCFDKQSMGRGRALAVEMCEESKTRMEFQQTGYVRRRQRDLARDLVQVQRGISVSILNRAERALDLYVRQTIDRFGAKYDIALVQQPA